MSGVFVVTTHARRARPLPVSTRPCPPDPRLSRLLWQALWLGALLVLLFPAARGHSAWLGWMPMWLLGMPLSALWALHRFRLPRLPLPAPTARGRRRWRGAQARRRSLRGGARRSVRAA